MQLALYGWRVVPRPGGPPHVVWSAVHRADTEEPLGASEEAAYRDSIVASVLVRTGTER